MEKFVNAGLSHLQDKKVEYGEIRIEEREQETIEVKNGKVENFSKIHNLGFGVRVLFKGAWGFASSNALDEEGIAAAVKKVVEIAKASAKFKQERVELAKEKAYKDSFKTPIKKNPFEVSSAEKLALLREATERMQKVNKVALAEGSMNFWRISKNFGNTEGSQITQEIFSAGAGIVATAIGEGEVQRRSYPSSFGGDFANRGYEFIEELKLPEHAEAIANGAAELLTAPICPSGRFDIIIGSAQMALQVHESCGHPSELDRALGTEISFAGGSFLTLEKRAISDMARIS